MRSVLTQDHPTNVRDLILNYGIDQPGKRVIDFTFANPVKNNPGIPARCMII